MTKKQENFYEKEMERLLEAQEKEQRKKYHESPWRMKTMSEEGLTFALKTFDDLEYDKQDTSREYNEQLSYYEEQEGKIEEDIAIAYGIPLQYGYGSEDDPFIRLRRIIEDDDKTITEKKNEILSLSKEFENWEVPDNDPRPYIR